MVNLRIDHGAFTRQRSAMHENKVVDSLSKARKTISFAQLTAYKPIN